MRGIEEEENKNEVNFWSKGISNLPWSFPKTIIIFGSMFNSVTYDPCSSFLF